MFLDMVMYILWKNFNGVINVVKLFYFNGLIEGINCKIKEFKCVCYGFFN